jgi:hypothetical protein
MDLIKQEIFFQPDILQMKNSLTKFDDFQEN